ncbi:MAG: gas vesicle protein K [Myxococcales bacterium]
MRPRNSRPPRSAAHRPRARAAPRSTRARVELDPDKAQNGVAQLVLTLVKFLHELLERQAVRRMEAGTLSDAEVERLGVALMKQAEQLERLRKEFGLEEKDLNLDLGPLGKLV